MKIVVDQNIPFARELLQQHGEVYAVDGRNIPRAALRDADVLLVRSITEVNQHLLNDATQLKFVGTATIGTEHIDLSLLAERGLGFASAPGCNAIAVGEYVISGLIAAAEHRQQSLQGKRIAIVGAGNTGTQVGRCAHAMGMQVDYYDPPRQEKGELDGSISFSQVLSADVISLHVPLNQQPPHASHHLFDSAALSQLHPEQILINACRGAVVDNKALLSLAKQGLAPLFIWDVWEFEPNVIKDLVPYAFIASPHIAGYSLEGKMRGTSMIYQAMCQHLQLVSHDLSAQLLADAGFPITMLNGEATFSQAASLCRWVYQPFADDKRFRQWGLSAEGFDTLRKQYPQRREFSTLSVVSKNQQPMLQELGFTIVEN